MTSTENSLFTFGGTLPVPFVAGDSPMNY